MRSLHRTLDLTLHRTAGNETTLLKLQPTMAHARDQMVVVGGNKYAYADLTELFKQSHHFNSKFGIEVAGWLIRQQ